MRRILLIVAMLLMPAATAMAVVSVSASQSTDPNGDCLDINVTYNCDAGEKIRAFALDINVDNGFIITQIKDFNRG